MKDKIIKQITIDIAGTEVSVTPQQAKELHEALGSLLGLEAKPVQQIIERHHYDRRPNVWPYSQPYWYGTTTAGTSNPEWDKWKITYSDNTGTANLSIT